MENTWIRRNKWIFFVAPLGIAVFVAIFGEVVMHLWNWLLPPLFGWRQIGFWQALGLLVLCRILFGGFGGQGSGGPKSRKNSSENWGRMTPEEREQFRQRMRSSCGGIDAPAGQPSEPV